MGRLVLLTLFLYLKNVEFFYFIGYIHRRRSENAVKEKLINWIKKNKEKKWMLFLDQLGFRFTDDNVSSIGSQLAYYAVLSIFPFIIFLLNIIRYTPLASTEILNSLVSVLPLDTQTIITDIVTGIIDGSSGTLLSVSALAGLWTASYGIMHLIKAINKAYDYEEQRSFIKLRLVSMFFTLVLSVLIILVFISLVFGEVIGQKLFTVMHGSSLFEIIWPILRIGIALLFMFIAFILLYKFAPAFPKGSRMTIKETLPGSIFVTVGWSIASFIFSFYVNNFGKYSVTYGSLGGVIVFLIWLYLSSIIVVLGGEVNATAEYFKINNWTYDGKKSVIKDFIEEKDNETEVL